MCATPIRSSISRSHRATARVIAPTQSRCCLGVQAAGQRVARQADPVERPAQVVRHDREDLVLGAAAGGLGLLAGGDVDERQDAAIRVGARVGQHDALDHDLDRGRAVAPQDRIAGASVPGGEHLVEEGPEATTVGVGHEQVEARADQPVTGEAEDRRGRAVELEDRPVAIDREVRGRGELVERAEPVARDGQRRVARAQLVVGGRELAILGLELGLVHFQRVQQRDRIAPGLPRRRPGRPAGLVSRGPSITLHVDTIATIPERGTKNPRARRDAGRSLPARKACAGAAVQAHGDSPERILDDGEDAPRRAGRRPGQHRLAIAVGAIRAVGRAQADPPREHLAVTQAAHLRSPAAFCVGVVGVMQRREAERRVAPPSVASRRSVRARSLR